MRAGSLDHYAQRLFYPPPAPQSPKLREYLQVLAVKDEAVKDGLYEEAGILHKREVDYR